MKLAATIQAMVTAGCTPEQVAAVVAAYGAEKAARNEVRRKADRERQQRCRARHAMSRDVTPVTVTPPPKKERVPPTPPLLEKTPPPLGLADARPVDEAVDVCLFNDLVKEKTEALRAFGEQWNRLAAAFKLPSIDEIKTGSSRERHALARLREMPAGGVDGLMARIRGSPYLRGEVNGFRCTFDWIINISNFQKIMEGNYENRKVVTPFRR